jgi:hypothetical protein
MSEHTQAQIDTPLSALSSSSKHMLRASRLLRDMAKCGVPKHMREQAESLAKSLEVSLVMRTRK